MRIIIFLTLVLLSCAPSVATPADDAFQAGKEFHKHGNWKDAIASFTKAIALNPNDSTLYHWRGLSCLFQSGMEDPKLGNRGTSYLQDLQQAVADFSKVIQVEPKNAQAYSERGDCYDKLDQLENAIADYNKAIQIDPGNCNAYQGRARVYRKKKQYSQALSDCDKALQLIGGQDDPHHLQFAWLHIDRAVIYEDQGKFKEAIKDYDNAIAIIEAAKNMTPVLPGFYALRAEAFRKDKQYEKAIDDCAKAAGFAPYPFPDSTLVTRGLSYGALGKDQKALDSYTQAIKRSSDFAQAYYERAKVYRRLGKDDLASKDLETSRRLGYTETK
jgi:tetratricopeptide (TPR) repeat protein